MPGGQYKIATSQKWWYLRTLASISHRELLWFYHYSTKHSPALVAPTAGDITSNQLTVQQLHSATYPPIATTSYI